MTLEVTITNVVLNKIVPTVPRIIFDSIQIENNFIRDQCARILIEIFFSRLFESLLCFVWMAVSPVLIPNDTNIHFNLIHVSIFSSPLIVLLQ